MTPSPTLPPRYLQAIRGVWELKPFKQIGHEMGISENTVKVYVYTAGEILEQRGKTALALWYERNVANLMSARKDKNGTPPSPGPSA